MVWEKDGQGLNKLDPLKGGEVYDRSIELACSNYYFKVEIGSSGNLALV